MYTKSFIEATYAMERPDTWVVRLELNNSVGWNWRVCRGGAGRSFVQNLNVTTGWVRAVGDCPIPSSGSLGKNLEVMAVKML